jgi:porin
MRHLLVQGLLGLVVLAMLTPLRAEEGTCPACESTPALDVTAAYSGEAWRHATGGIRRGGRYLDNLELQASAEGARFGLDGLKLFGSLLYNNGQGLSDELVGASQGVSNIETERAVRLFELWGEWQLGTRDSLRAGLYDLNSEFDSIPAAALFIQPSQGIGADFAQSGQNGPSIFPTTALALRAKRTVGTWSLQAAVLDGVPGDLRHPRRTRIRLSKDEGALLVGEAGRDFAGLHISAGYWQYTARFEDLEMAAARRDNAGAYLSVASPRLLGGPAGQGLDLYVRAGQAESRVNAISEYLGAGAVYNGLFSRDGDDQLGVSVASARLGAPFRRTQADLGTATTRRELVWELTYRFSLTHWLALQPDVQYIRHPGMDPQLESSWLFGLRVDVSHAWAR